MSQRSSQLQQRGRSTRRAAAVWCLAIALFVQSARAGSPWRRGSGPLLTHHLSKRSFFDIQCKGVYDKTIFAKLDRICEDCYNLFREPQVHSLCMKNCFTTGYFKGCLETLQLTDEMEQVKDWIKQIHGAPPDDEEKSGGLDTQSRRDENKPKKHRRDAKRRGVVKTAVPKQLTKGLYKGEYHKQHSIDKISRRHSKKSTPASQCFTTEYFKSCVEALLMSEEMPNFRKMIEYLAK